MDASREAEKVAAAEVGEPPCTKDPETRGGNTPPDGRKVKATLHWVAARHAVPAEARLYDHLFLKPDPDDVEEGRTWLSNLNSDSLEVTTCYVEPSVISRNNRDPVPGGALPGTRYQFE